MAKTRKPAEPGAIEIESVKTLEIEVCLLRSSPLLCNRLGKRAQRELLLPAPPKNKAERAMTLKHQPYDEYRASVYASRDEDGPTRLLMPGGAFRKAIATAALDIPGSSKAQIGRLVRVVEYDVSVYGLPRISCMGVRQAGMNKTPDVRTRAIVPDWACRLTLKFPSPLLKEKTVLTLLAQAGDFIGVGDGRNEKGSSLSCGCFTICGPGDPDFLRICATGGREAQDAALENPEAYDQETAELLEWFDREIERRDESAPRSNHRIKEKEMIP